MTAKPPLTLPLESNPEEAKVEELRWMTKGINFTPARSFGNLAFDGHLVTTRVSSFESRQHHCESKHDQVSIKKR